MNNMKIGNFIKEQRIKNNLSQNQLSEILHVTRQAISNWENGKAIPDSGILIELSKLFNVSVDDILLGEKSKEENELQKLTLNLIDETNKEKGKIKKLFITLLVVITSFAVCFLSYYFITTYNSIKLYVTSGESKNYVMFEGFIIHTRQKTYINFGEINGKNKIDKIEYYYTNENNEEILLATCYGNQSLIVEEHKYEEISHKNFKRNINKMYAIITSDDKEEKIKINIREDFKNSGIFNNKRQKFIDEEKNKIDEEIAIVVKNDDKKEKEEEKATSKVEENKEENKNRSENKNETDNSQNQNREEEKVIEQPEFGSCPFYKY